MDAAREEEVVLQVEGDGEVAGLIEGELRAGGFHMRRTDSLEGARTRIRAAVRREGLYSSHRSDWLERRDRDRSSDPAIADPGPGTGGVRWRLGASRDGRNAGRGGPLQPETDG